MSEDGGWGKARVGLDLRWGVQAGRPTKNERAAGPLDIWHLPPLTPSFDPDKRLLITATSDLTPAVGRVSPEPASHEKPRGREHREQQKAPDGRREVSHGRYDGVGDQRDGRHDHELPGRDLHDRITGRSRKGGINRTVTDRASRVVAGSKSEWGGKNHGASFRRPMHVQLRDRPCITIYDLIAHGRGVAGVVARRSVPDADGRGSRPGPSDPLSED